MFLHVVHQWKIQFYKGTRKSTPSEFDHGHDLMARDQRRWEGLWERQLGVRWFRLKHRAVCGVTDPTVTMGIGINLPQPQLADIMPGQVPWMLVHVFKPADRSGARAVPMPKKDVRCFQGVVRRGTGVVGVQGLLLWGEPNV